MGKLLSHPGACSVRTPGNADFQHQGGALPLTPGPGQPGLADGALLLLCICCPLAPFMKGWRKRGAVGPLREGGERKHHPKNIWLSLRLMKSPWLCIYCRRLAGVGNLSHEVSNRRDNLPAPDRGKQCLRRGAAKSLLRAQKKQQSLQQKAAARILDTAAC